MSRATPDDPMSPVADPGLIALLMYMRIYERWNFTRSHTNEKRSTAKLPMIVDEEPTVNVPGRTAVKFATKENLSRDAVLKSLLFWQQLLARPGQ